MGIVIFGVMTQNLPDDHHWRRCPRRPAPRPACATRCRIWSRTRWARPSSRRWGGLTCAPDGSRSSRRGV